MTSDPYDAPLTEMLVESHYSPGQPIGAELSVSIPFLYFAPVGFCPECKVAAFETRAERCPICNAKMEGH